MLTVRVIRQDINLLIHEAIPFGSTQPTISDNWKVAEIRPADRARELVSSAGDDAALAL